MTAGAPEHFKRRHPTRFRLADRLCRQAGWAVAGGIVAHASTSWGQTRDVRQGAGEREEETALASAREGGAAVQPGDTAEALPGFVRIPLPIAGPSSLGFSGTMHYGLYERFVNLTRASHQLGALLAAGWSPVDFVSVRGQMRGALQVSPGEPAGSDTSSYGEPEVAIRGQMPFGNWHLGAELEARLIGAEAPSIDFAATTPTLRLLTAHELGPVTWLGGSLGYRFDRSAVAVDQPLRLRVGDRFLLEASSYDAVELGFGVSHRVSRTELLAELTADVLVGRGSPTFIESPISVTLGARHPLTRSLEVRGNIEVSPSVRPDPFFVSELMPFRPRFAVGVGLSYRFFVPQTADADDTAARKRAEEEAARRQAEADAARQVREEAESDEPARGAVTGTVVDEGGHPQSDVLVILKMADGQAREIHTDANGRFSFSEVPAGSGTIRTDVPGYEDAQKQVEVTAGAEEPPTEIVIYPAMPAGELHGKVQDLAGSPVPATVSVEPGDITAEVQEDGSFALDLRPGRYTVRFKHPDYQDQVRRIHIVERGVVVLNIALHK